MGLLIIIPSISHATAALTLETLLDDDFNAMNASNWHIPTWQYDGDGTFVGRTQFRCTQNSPLPTVSGSNAIITVESYNPTGFSFYGYDLISNQSFTLGQGIIVTVRAKMNAPAQPGVVGGIFLYALKPGSNTLHDEIDFELLGNHPNEVWTNIYGNEPLGTGHPVSYPYASGSVTDYHTYEIRWLPNQVSWSIDGNIVRTVTVQSPIPTGPMNLHLNMWVPNSDWADAYSATIQPTGSPSSNQIFSMSVDWVKVQSLVTPPPVVGDYSIKSSIKFYDWKCNKWAVVKTGTLHITNQDEHKIEGYWEPDTALGWSDNISVKGYVGSFVRNAKGKVKNTPRLSLLLESGTYCTYPSNTYVTYILNGKIKWDKKTDKVKSIKGTINGWGEFGTDPGDGNPPLGQFEGKFTATPVP
jgi:beta-glucanase (GH16 family)